MKKILYIWKDKYPWDIRVEKFCKSLLNAGYEVLLLARWKGEEKEEEMVDGIQVRRAGYKKNILCMQPVSLNPLWKADIKKNIAAFAPDLIIVREILLAQISGKIARRKGIPVIMDMAENYPAAMKLWDKYSKNPILRFLVHTLNIPEMVEKKSVPLMSGILTVCPEQVKRLGSVYNYPESKTAVVHNTPVIDKNHDFKAFNNNYIFGHHGYMSSDKNLISFIKGFFLACENNNNIRLFLAGKGENFEAIKELVGKSKYHNRIILFGEYQYSQMEQIMNMYSIGILPYEPNDFNNYTIHNKLFDYFAFGKPVIAANMNPVMKILDRMKAGKFYDMSDAEKIKDAILDFINEDLSTFSENSFEASKIYNWGNDSKKLIDFIGLYI